MKYFELKHEKGFVGLLGLLITVFIISFLVWKMGAAEHKTPSLNGSSEPNTLGGFNAIDQAKAAKNLIEKNFPSAELAN